MEGNNDWNKLKPVGVNTTNHLFRIEKLICTTLRFCIVSEIIFHSSGSGLLQLISTFVLFYYRKKIL